MSTSVVCLRLSWKFPPCDPQSRLIFFSRKTAKNKFLSSFPSLFPSFGLSVIILRSPQLCWRAVKWKLFLFTTCTCTSFGLSMSFINENVLIAKVVHNFPWIGCTHHSLKWEYTYCQMLEKRTYTYFGILDSWEIWISRIIFYLLDDFQQFLRIHFRNSLRMRFWDCLEEKILARWPRNLNEVLSNPYVPLYESLLYFSETSGIL